MNGSVHRYRCRRGRPEAATKRNLRRVEPSRSQRALDLGHRPIHSVLHDQQPCDVAQFIVREVDQVV